MNLCSKLALDLRSYFLVPIARVFDVFYITRKYSKSCCERPIPFSNNLKTRHEGFLVTLYVYMHICNLKVNGPFTWMGLNCL